MKVIVMVDIALFCFMCLADKNKTWVTRPDFLSSFFLPHEPEVALVVKNLPSNAGDTEILVQSLGREDPLELDMAPHSSILAWAIPRTEEPGGLHFMGSQESDKTE